jgi:hypothetical protein
MRKKRKEKRENKNPLSSCYPSQSMVLEEEGQISLSLILSKSQPQSLHLCLTTSSDPLRCFLLPKLSLGFRFDFFKAWSVFFYQLLPPSRLTTALSDLPTPYCYLTQPRPHYLLHRPVWLIFEFWAVSLLVYFAFKFFLLFFLGF